MKGFMFKIVIILFSSILWLSLAAASSIDESIKNLKNENPDIRAKAAYDLGCG
jgi:hypothetical protein